MISSESPWQRLSDRWTSKDNAERRDSVVFYILQRQLNLYLEQGQIHVFFVIYNSCHWAFCKSMLVRKLPFYWLVVELLVYFTFHVHFWMVSRWKSWQCHSDRWASKDNAEKRASVAFFILRQQFNSHFCQSQNHVFSCNIQFMPRIFV